MPVNCQSGASGSLDAGRADSQSTSDLGSCGSWHRHAAHMIAVRLGCHGARRARPARRRDAVRAARRRSHLHHRQPARRAPAVPRVARHAAARALSAARPGHPQPRLLRRRGRDPSAVEELRQPGRVAERQRRGDRRLPGEPAEGRQHQGGRHLRVLRLQRVVRRRRRIAGLSKAARRLAHPHAGAEVQRQDGAAHRAVLADRARGPAQPGSARRPREQRPARAVYAGDGAGGRGARRAVRRSLRAEQGALRGGEDAADHQRRPLERGGQPPDRRGHRPRSVRRAAPRLSARLPDGAAAGGRRTRASSGSTATAPPTASPPTAIARS